MLIKKPDVSGLVTTIALNLKIEEVENKIPDHAKCITTTQEFNKITAENFTATLKEGNLVNNCEKLRKLRN